jgi:hypothetical protein
VAVVFIVLVACGHSAPSPPESPARPAELASTESPKPTLSANDASLGSEPPDISSGAGRPSGGEIHGDEAHHQPLDLKVWDSHVDGGTLIVSIELPPELSTHYVDRHWTGIFTADDKPIPGTDFTVGIVLGHEISVRYSGMTLPSRTVRLFQPGSERVTPARGDEAHRLPLDLSVYDATPRGHKLRVRIGLPPELPANLVNRDWTGVFTDAGTPIPDTGFVVAGTFGREITVDYNAATLPSRTVRLFPPKP